MKRTALFLIHASLLALQCAYGETLPPPPNGCTRLTGDALRTWNETLNENADHHALIFDRRNTITIPPSGQVQNKQCVQVDNNTLIRLQFRQATANSRRPDPKELITLCGDAGGATYEIAIEGTRCVRRDRVSGRAPIAPRSPEGTHSPGAGSTTQ